MQTDYQKIQEILEEHKEEIIDTAKKYEKRMDSDACAFVRQMITSRTLAECLTSTRNEFIRDMCKITKLDKCTCNFFADNYLR